MMSNMTEGRGTAALSNSKWKCCVPAAVNSESCLPVVQFILQTDSHLYNLF